MLFACGYHQDETLSHIDVVAMNPGNFPDSRALIRNTPQNMHRLQKYFLKPLLPLLRLSAPTLRSSTEGGHDIIELAVNPIYKGEQGFFTLLKKDVSSPESQDEAKQQMLWVRTLQWAEITKDNTALEVAFDG